MVFHRIFRQLCAVLVISGGLVAPAFSQGARGPSTPEEHARVVQLAAVSDKDPIAAMTSAQGRWFEKWADDIPDYHFGPDNGAFWMMNGAAKGDLVAIAPAAALGAFDVPYAIAGGSDPSTFFDAAIPAFVAMHDLPDYLSHTQHSEVDSIDHVKQADLVQAAQSMAVTAWGLLNGERLPHQERAARQ